MARRACLACLALLLAACGNDRGIEPPPRHVSLPARVRLLTDEQYANAVRDLLDISVPLTPQPGTEPHQFIHEDLLAVDGPLLVQFRIAAEAVAAEISSRPDALGCGSTDGTDGTNPSPGTSTHPGNTITNTSHIDDACARDQIAAFASRAFRRPLEDDELSALWQLYVSGRDDRLSQPRPGPDSGPGPSQGGARTPATSAGFALVVEAVLQSPSFVYRTELGGIPASAAPSDPASLVALTPYELAAELSFLLTDSIPDPALWAAASDGTLAHPDVLADHVERILSTDRAHAHLTDVILRWLGAYRVLDARKDATIFSALTPDLRRSMLTETRLFVDDVLWHRGGSLRELLTSSETFVDAPLAHHYGRSTITSETHVRTTLRGYQRGGILTHASILTALGTEQRESIIRRGMFVHEKLLCTPELGRPPFGAIAAQAHFTHAMSEAQFSYFRTAHVYCSGCHHDIDPPGRALHHYDGIGRYRDLDENDQPIESDGTLSIGGAPHTFHDAVELGHALADSDHVARCVVDQLVHHALGRAMDPSLRRFLHRRFDDADRDLVEIFRALATSPQFRLRLPGSSPR